jgi:hypothetical protein
MNRSAIAAAALVGASALTGSAVLPGSATAAVATHTKVFRDWTLADHALGGLTNGGADVLKSGGKVIGYDSYDAKTFAASGKHVVWGSFALRGGTITTRVTAHGHGGRGRILGGTFNYTGIQGTVTIRSKRNGSEVVTLQYHF